LTRALVDGALKGQVGSLNLTAVNCEGLKAAIAAAEDLKQMSESTKLHLVCSQIILRLRMSILAGDNNGVRKVCWSFPELRFVVSFFVPQF
jgi:hypothetical protein